MLNTTKRLVSDLRNKLLNKHYGSVIVANKRINTMDYIRNIITLLLLTSCGSLKTIYVIDVVTYNGDSKRIYHEALKSEMFEIDQVVFRGGNGLASDAKYYLKAWNPRHPGKAKVIASKVKSAVIYTESDTINLSIY